MNTLNIKKAIFLPTGSSPDNKGFKERMAALLQVAKKYPDRIIPFATIDVAANDSPQVLEDTVKNGAKGLKLLAWLDDRSLEPVNSPRMYRVYNKVRELKIPILIHVEILSHPEWKAQFEQVLKDFPDITFIVPHYCRTVLGKQPIRLDMCGKLLDTYPNMYIDISMGTIVARYINRINNDPKPFKDFIIKYQDRILWGADGPALSKAGEIIWTPRVESDLDMLEKETYYSSFADTDDPQKGLHLPESVLKKIYWENPKSILGEKVLGKL